MVRNQSYANPLYESIAGSYGKAADLVSGATKTSSPISPVLQSANLANKAFSLTNQNMSVENPDYLKALAGPTIANAEALKKDVAMVDTDSAISVVNDQKAELDRIAPENTFDASGRQLTAGGVQLTQPQEPPKVDLPKEEPPKEEGKATFVNDIGMKTTYTQSQLNDPEIQQYLKMGGYVLESSEGALPYGYEEKADPEAKILQDNAERAEKAVEDLVSDWQGYNVDKDPDYQNYAQTINSQFEQMRRNMQRVNESRQRAYETAAMRGGTARYAGEIAGGIMGEEIRQGNERIAEITRQEMASIAQARLAFQEGKWTEFSRKVDALKDIREQKQKELENYNKLLVDANKALQEEEKFNFEKQKFAFDVFKYEQSQKGMDIGTAAPGSAIFDKKTGQIIGTVPKPEDIKAPTIQKINGVDMQWNPTLMTWETPTGALAQALGVASEDAKNWAGLITSGQANITNIPDDNLRNQVVGILNKMPPKPEDVDAIQSKITTLDEILTHKGLNESVGPNRLARWDIIPTGAKQDFIGAVQELLSEKTLQSLIDAKAKGATFGALSEGELKILQQAATRIGNWAVEKDGKVVGYNVSEKAFKDEIKRIRDDYTKLMTDNQQKGMTPERKAISDYYLKNPDKREWIESVEMMTNPDTGQPLDDYEKAQLLGISFKEDLNKSVKGLTQVKIGNQNVSVSNQVADRLEAADRLFYKATGQHIKVAEAYRSTERQAELYAKYLRGEGGRAAPAGKSFHQTGNAIDVVNWKEAEKYLRMVGLKNELSDDKNHFSIGEFA